MLTDRFADLVDLVLPRACIGCGAAGTVLCGDCAAVALVDHVHGGIRVVAAAPYEGPLRTALLAYKERGRRDLARPLRVLLMAAVAQHACSDAVLVPVPSTAAARRARGGDHVQRLLGPRLLGRRLLGRCPLGRCLRTARALRLTRAVRDSAGLDTAARAANLAGAFRAERPGRPDAVAIVVDDITTTGATLGEATRALRSAGWSVAGAAVIAATARRVPAARVVPATGPSAAPGDRPRAGLT